MIDYPPYWKRRDCWCGEFRPPITKESRDRHLAPFRAKLD